MTDPKEIEGSAERAADRGREEDLGIVLPTDRPFLGDAAVVRGLVSEFASQVVAVRKAYNADKMSGVQAQQRIRELAREYGDVVMGRDPSYTAMAWNSPDQLGRQILRVVPSIAGVTDPGELLFLTVGGSLVDLAMELEDDRMGDGDVKAKVEAMLSDAAAVILGHPR